MERLKKAFKTEIRLNEAQKRNFHQSVGICRWLYNAYIAKNKEQYALFLEGKTQKKFMTANDFDKYINNDVKKLEDFLWVNMCGSKARKKAIMNAETAFKRFFKGVSKFPRFKKKKHQDVKLYFPKNNPGDWTVERHRIKIPTFGWVELKEFGYMPTNLKVSSGTVSQKANRYYVSVVVEVAHTIPSTPQSEGIGIDLGLKNFAIISDGTVVKNINKTARIKTLEKKMKRAQRRLSRKYESLKRRSKKQEGRATRQNIQKQVHQVQKLHHQLTNIRTDYINKMVSSIVKRNPSYITIEDLNVQGMMKNRHLSKAVAQQKFYEFRIKLEIQCKLNGIELRVVDRFYPSSKLCSCCGYHHKELKLSDRMYRCSNCHTSMDRDRNASLNLKNAKEYEVA